MIFSGGIAPITHSQLRLLDRAAQHAQLMAQQQKFGVALDLRPPNHKDLRRDGGQAYTPARSMSAADGKRSQDHDARAPDAIFASHRLRKILDQLEIPVDLVNKPGRGYSLVFR